MTITKQDFDKEGTLPVFILRVKDDAGNVSERKYKLNTPIVRRVLAPGEVPTRSQLKRGEARRKVQRFPIPAAPFQKSYYFSLPYTNFGIVGRLDIVNPLKTNCLFCAVVWIVTCIECLVPVC